MISTLDLWYFTLSFCLLFISIPLVMILWRTFFLLGSLQRVMESAETVGSFLVKLQSVPRQLLESFLARLRGVEKEKEEK